MAKVLTGKSVFPKRLFVYKDYDGDSVYYIANETERRR